MKVSIIVRTRNEERWISSCLKAVYSQDFKDFEVIIVDNESRDSTLAKVSQFPVRKILTCTDYLPGKALNIGIKAAEGQFIVCLSGHCIPTNSSWLGNLYRDMQDPEVAAAYGRQEPLSFTPPADKRDLMIVFGPERRVQRKDSFFHNANSMIKKEVLDQYPFDDKITNIEDRVWAQVVINHGYAIVYEPEASVYHHHGIHQDGNQLRCQNVVKILESLNGKAYQQDHMQRLQDLNIVSFIPVKGTLRSLGGKPLLEYAIRASRQSKYIKSTIVAADEKQVLQSAREMGAEKTLLRDPSLSQEYVGLEKVYRFILQQLEAEHNFPDIIVLLETTYPFRDAKLIDDLLDRLVYQGLDTILPAKIENNAIWVDGEDGMKRVDGGFIPRNLKSPVYLSYKGLCCVTRPEFIRNEEILGDKIGVMKIENPYYCMEFRDDKDWQMPDVSIFHLN
ncbi:MAG: glycosyltransferase family 2 protein [Deltaproteobacteria bacterium]|nr:glycosyltransferase family 2 protein [Deltaproteobacteria bacterium]